jgi:hypothetical protein
MKETIIRHRVREDKWNVIFYDPYKKRDAELSLFEELYKHLERPKSARFVVIDSVDAAGFTNDDYHRLNARFGGKKGFVWLSFEANKLPKTALAKTIGGEGDYIIRVLDFIAEVKKSRHGGWADYIIWEQKAKERNPLYFEMKEAPVVPKGKKGKKAKA